MQTLHIYLDSIKSITKDDKEFTHRTALQNLLESYKTHKLVVRGGATHS